VVGGRWFGASPATTPSRLLERVLRHGPVRAREGNQRSASSPESSRPSPPAMVLTARRTLVARRRDGAARSAEAAARTRPRQPETVALQGNQRPGRHNEEVGIMPMQCYWRSASTHGSKIVSRASTGSKITPLCARTGMWPSDGGSTASTILAACAGTMYERTSSNVSHRVSLDSSEALASPLTYSHSHAIDTGRSG
jgi:hypothetical protein